MAAFPQRRQLDDRELQQKFHGADARRRSLQLIVRTLFCRYRERSRTPAQAKAV